MFDISFFSFLGVSFPTRLVSILALGRTLSLAMVGNQPE